MKMFYNTVFFVFIILFLFSCQTSTEPERQKEVIPYMTLSIGDIRQYYEDQGGTYIQWEVIDTVKRADGQKIFRVEESFLLPGEVFRGTNYYFIRDNSFWLTQLDSVHGNSKENIFNEEKIAELFPKNGDYFLRTVGVSDSLKVFFKVSLIDSLKIYCGKFESVAKYELIDSDNSSSQLIYYAPKYGHLGSIIENQHGKTKIFASYIKTGGEEIGRYVSINAQKLITKQKRIENNHSYYFGN